MKQAFMERYAAPKASVHVSEAMGPTLYKMGRVPNLRSQFNIAGWEAIGAAIVKGKGVAPAAEVLAALKALKIGHGPEFLGYCLRSGWLAIANH